MYKKRTEIEIDLKWLILLVCAIVSVFVASFLNLYFNQTHFENGTTINGIDCSNLSVEEAEEKIVQEANQPITFVTVLPYQQGNKEYVAEAGQFDIKLNKKVNLGKLLERQNEDKSQLQFEIDKLFTVNERALEEYLSTIPELIILNGNMVHPQDAYLTLENDSVVIVPEVYGNEIDLGDDYYFALKALQNGETRIDFSEITITDPIFLKDDEWLQSQRDKLNTMLNTTISFSLSNGNTVVLHEVIKEWIEDELDSDWTSDISLKISVKEGIYTFLEQLADEVDKANSWISFPATGIGNVSMYVHKDVRTQLDIEAEAQQIMKELETGKTITRDPIYTEPLLTDNLNTYIELDITRQTMWVYVDGECVLETLCRTGNEAMGDGTPTGIFYLRYKTRGATLTGYNYDGSRYNSYVEYWMQFNGGIGFHDASWVHVFGGNYYLTQGSHGCVNLPEWAAATLYSIITTDMPIFIYKS